MTPLSARTPPVHVESKFACTNPDRQKSFARDYDFALRYENAVDDPTVQHPYRVGSEILPYDCVYYVGRQSERSIRWRPVGQRHFYFPPHKALENHRTLRTVGNLNHSFVGIFLLRAAPCARAGSSHPRARKTTDAIHISRPTTAAITTTIIKSSQSKDIYSTSLSRGERRFTAFPAPGTVAVTVATISARAA